MGSRSEPRTVSLPTLPSSCTSAARSGTRDTSISSTPPSWCGGGIPPLREVIAQGVDGFCVRQRADDVAAAIQRLLDDPALRSTMGRAGSAKLAQKWDWDRVIDRVEEAYARALAHANADVGEALA